MRTSALTVVLSCHSLGEFPVYHEGAAAEGLLAAWSALWHPELIAAAGNTPSWRSADAWPDEELAGQLVILPTVVESDVPGAYVGALEDHGAMVVSELDQRPEIVGRALEIVRADGAAARHVNAELADDFHALGTCYLLTEILTSRMRHMSMLDENRLSKAALEAAQAAVSGDEQSARQKLASSFEVLQEARCHFYPVDAYLVDLLLVAPSTLGPALRTELTSDVPLNLLLSAGVLQEMAQRDPETLELVRAGIERGTIGIVGGELNEVELPLMSLESILAQFRIAGEIYQRLLGRLPATYGRRRIGFSPALPQILMDAGFAAALHVQFDEGRMPQPDRAKSGWEGLDGATIDMLCREPLDAASPETMLEFPDKLGDTMDHDFVATLLFARWPGRGSAFYRDLRRMAKYAPALAKFTTLDAYFTETEASEQFSKFSPDQYRAPLLRAAVGRSQTDPISSLVRYRRLRVGLLAAEAAALMASAVSGETSGAQAPSLDALELHGPQVAPEDHALQSAAIDRSLNQSWTALVAALTGGASTAEQGYLLVNPLNFPRRAMFDLPKLNDLPTVDSTVLAADGVRGIPRAVVEIPPMGFAWVGASSPSPARSTAGKRGKPAMMVEENVLRNQYCEVKIHPETGGIGAIYDYRTRGNRLSQQLAVRLPPEAIPPTDSPLERPVEYTSMVAEAIEVAENDAVLGRIVSRGRLVDAAGKCWCRFVQTTSLWQESRTIEMSIELSDCAPLARDPWRCYVASRFAWADSTADVFRSVHGCRVPTQLQRLEAPDYVEVVTAKTRTAILTGGLPYHRRSDDRMLDCLLQVAGESENRFQLGIGIDLSRAWRAAAELAQPAALLGPCPRPASGEAGWLFHIDVPGIAATHWAAIEDAGRVVGFRVRLLETDGRAGQVRLRPFRAPISARRTTLFGKDQEDLWLDDGAVVMDFAAYEWMQVEVRWA